MIIDDRLLTREEKILFSLRELFDRYGYTRFTMSRFEEYDLYAGSKDFLLSDRIISFTNLDGRLMAMKPDVTISILRQIDPAADRPQKVFYSENVYRAAAGDMSFREIMQAGVESIGSLKDEDIFSTIALAADSLALIDDNYILAMSHPAFVSGLLESANVKKEDYRPVLDCVRAKNTQGLRRVCAELGLDENAAARILCLTDIYGGLGESIRRLEPICSNDTMTAALNEMKGVYTYLEKAGRSDKVEIDFSIVNNMDYYDGIVFQGFISGLPSGVLSGGQYGGLVQKMGKNGTAIGFAVYVDELRFLDR